MQLFYSPDIKKDDALHDFDKDESRHIINVLRKTKGDEIGVTNGKGLLFNARISNANAKRCTVEVMDITVQEKHPYYLHMFVAPTKMNDRLEWFLEKATEIGIDEITPIICENSERKILKLERLNRVLLSAMKQSLKAYLPKINEPILFKDLSPNLDEKFHLAYCGDIEKQPLSKILKPNTDYKFLIGPEGDFSENEIKTALEHNVQLITLGNSRLRTETAALYVCNALAFVN
ncbi:MAG: 16S rRNA (uracil(1498)-N(3))-methyltransferase [Flavobacteriaceae bacterium]|nr:16S rRNA (uracil(1498)-N(3))-methyltransferase [Flavobacteriaceae bacterium]